MDMRKTLPRQITNDELKQGGGSYTGVVCDVGMEEKWNRFTREKREQPVMTFTDGYTLVPNMGIRRGLIAKFGSESDRWCGKQVTVRLQKFSSKSSGEVRFEKVLDDWHGPEEGHAGEDA